MKIPKQENIVGYWKGTLNQDGTLQDFSDENHGTLGGNTSQIETPYGSGTDHDGNGDIITVSHDSSLNTGDVITVSIMIKPPTSSAWDTSGLLNRVIVEKGAPNSFGGNDNDRGWTVGIRESTNDIKISLRDMDSGDTITAGALNAGVWNHLVMIYDDTNCITYFDGVLDEVNTFSAGLLDTSEDLVIGADRANPTGRAFQGTIGHTMILDTVLNPNEVKQLYQAMQRLTARR